MASAISGSMWSEKNWNGARSPYSSPMNSSGTNGDSSVQKAASGRSSRAQPVAERAVADLVVVLAVDDEPLGRSDGIERAGELPSTSAEPRVVVAVALAGQQHVQRVVKVVDPDRVAVPALRAASGSSIPISPITSAPVPLAVHAPRDRGDDVLGAGVEDRVDRVEPQPVDPEVPDPAGRRSAAPTRGPRRFRPRRS